MLLQLGFDLLELADVGADRDVFFRCAVGPEEGHDGGVQPVILTRLVAVFDFVSPGLAAEQRLVHRAPVAVGAVAGADDAMVVADQFLAPVSADLHKGVVDVVDRALGVGDRNDGVLVERRFLLHQLALRGLDVGQVVQDAGKALRPVDLGVRERDADADLVAVFVQHGEFAGVHHGAGLAGAQVTGEIAVVMRGVGFGHQHADVLADRFAGAVAQQLARCRVEAADGAPDIDRDDGVEGGVEHAVVDALEILQARFFKTKLAPDHQDAGGGKYDHPGDQQVEIFAVFFQLALLGLQGVGGGGAEAFVQFVKRADDGVLAGEDIGHQRGGGFVVAVFDQHLDNTLLQHGDARDQVHHAGEVLRFLGRQANLFNDHTRVDEPRGLGRHALRQLIAGKGVGFVGHAQNRQRAFTRGRHHLLQCGAALFTCREGFFDLRIELVLGFVDLLQQQDGSQAEQEKKAKKQAVAGHRL